MHHEVINVTSLEVTHQATGVTGTFVQGLKSSSLYGTSVWEYFGNISGLMKYHSGAKGGAQTQETGRAAARGSHSVSTRLETGFIII